MKIYAASRKSLADMSDMEVLEYIKGKNLWVLTNTGYYLMVEDNQAFLWPDIVVMRVPEDFVEDEHKGWCLDRIVMDARQIPLANPRYTMTTMEILERIGQQP